MKQTKISAALAALALVSAPAFAQSNVTVYGIADVGVNIANGGNGTKFMVQSGQYYGSRLGFKGEEALGNNLKAIFQLEMGLSLDTGRSTQGGTLFGRQAYAGLKGNFGQATIGRQYTPMFIVLDSVDAFGTGLGPNLANSLGNVPGGGSNYTRWDNSIFYSTPSFSGLTATVGFTSSASGNVGQELGTSTSAANNDKVGRGWTGAVQYENGPIYAAVSYIDVNKPTALTNDVKDKGLIVGGSYDLKVAKLFASYANGKTDSNAGELAKQNGYSAGVRVPFGAHTVIGEYSKLRDKKNADADFGLWGLGYEYSLSKRTTLYATYAKGINDNNAAYVLAGAATNNDPAVNTGYNPTSVMAGMVHKF